MTKLAALAFSALSLTGGIKADKSDICAPRTSRPPQVAHTRREWDVVLPTYRTWNDYATTQNLAGHACHAWVETNAAGKLEVLFGCTY